MAKSLGKNFFKKTEQTKLGANNEPVSAISSDPMQFSFLKKDSGGSKPSSGDSALKATIKAAEKIAQAYKATSKVIEKVNKIVDAFLTLKWGKFNLGILDGLGAEIVSAVSKIGYELAEAALKKAMNTNVFAGFSIEDIGVGLKKAFAGVIEAVMGVLLDAGQSIFALVKIPLDEAREQSEKEARHLMEADAQMRVILFLVRKWFGGNRGDRFYKQMVDAMPFLNAANGGLKSLISGLSDEQNASFDANTFTSVQASLKRAIEITDPDGSLLDELGITARKEREKQKRSEQKRIDINKKYDQRRLSIDAKRISDISKVNADINAADKEYKETTGSNDDAFGNKAKTRSIRLIDTKWSADVDANERRRRHEVATMEANVSAEVEIDKEFLARAIGSAADAKRVEFFNDLWVMRRALIDYLEHLKTAYLAYQQKKALCYALYKIRSLISFLVAQMIDLNRNIGNGASEEISDAFETAQKSTQSAIDLFNRDIKLYEQGNKSSTVMSLDVTQGNCHARFSSALLNAFMADALDALFNTDDLLEKDSDNYNEFQNRLRNIPKWNNKDKDRWIDSALDLGSSPYIALLSNAALALTVVPILSMSKDSGEKEKLKKTLNEIADDMALAISHNSAVNKVLESYEPPDSQLGNELLERLQSLNMTTLFAGTMSLAVITDIISTTVLSDTSKLAAAFGGSYPFTSSNKTLTELSLGMKQQERDIVPATASNNNQAAEEKKSVSRMELLAQLAVTGRLFGVTESELYAQPPV